MFYKIQFKIIRIKVGDIIAVEYRGGAKTVKMYFLTHPVQFEIIIK